MMHNNDYNQFEQIIDENEMKEFGSEVLAERLRHAESAANNLFGILGILAARQDGRLEFTQAEWNAKLPYKSVAFGEDMDSGEVVIEFNE